MLSSPGIGSGLDVNAIVTQLISLEQQPLLRLGERQLELEAQISGFGALTSAMSTFKSAMQELSDFNKFQVFSTNSSDEEVLTASASSTAARGAFSIRVDRIAENHRLASNTVFADADTTTTGTAGDMMTIAVGAAAFDVDIGAKTLNEVRDAINNTSTNTGVTASILKEDSGYRLILSTDETGSTNEVTASYSAADPFALQTLNADRDGDLVFTAADLNAVLTIENQFTVTSNSNSVTDAIGGVTLNLEKAGSLTLTIDRDTPAVKDSIDEFVNGYNEVIELLGSLRGDVLRSENLSLLSMESQFRDVLNTSVEIPEVAFSFLFELGISTKTDGTLEVDGELVNNALEADFDGVAQLFSDPTSGFAFRMEQLADGFIGAAGVLDLRVASLEGQVDDVEDQRIALQRRIGLKEERLLAEFGALDTLLAGLNATSGFLTSQLSVLENLNLNNSGS